MPVPADEYGKPQEDRMKLAYIAGPYRSDTSFGIKQNIMRAEEYALKWWKKGYAVLCPHANTAHFDNALPDEAFLNGTLEMMLRCDVVVMMPNWKDSYGARNEHDVAIAAGMEVIYE